MKHRRRNPALWNILAPKESYEHFHGEGSTITLSEGSANNLTGNNEHLLKVSCFLTRRADLTHEEFFSYWTGKHVPLLAKPMPGDTKIAHSIHLHTIPENVPELWTAPYDGVAEIWFENLEDAKALLANEHYITVAGKDEENFLDRSKTTFLFCMRRRSSE